MNISVRIGAATRLVVPIATMLLLIGCGGSAGSAPSSPAAPAPGASASAGAAAASPQATEPTEPSNAASPDGGGTDPTSGPIGGDIGDPAKGSVKAQVTGGLTASIDLPLAAALAQWQVSGGNGVYLPYTDTERGTLFLTINDGQLLVQYAGPDNVGMTNGGTPCELHIDTLDGSQAKGSFTCKGMLLIKGETMGSADMTGSFEGHK